MKYYIGGITIESPIIFPELLPSKEEVDYTIDYGDVPEKLNNVCFERVLLQTNKEGEVLVRIPNIARYFFNGESITIQLLKDAKKENAEKYILSFLFGILSFHKGYFPLHGGGIVYNGEAYLFTGKPGVGKSTLLSALEEKGFSLLSDDISNLFFHNNRVFVHPSFPRYKLWEDSLELLNRKGKDEYPLRSDINKYFVPIKKFNADSVPVKRIYLLNESQNDQIKITELKGVQKFNILRINIYKQWLPKAFNMQQDFFTLTNSLLPHINIKRFDRSKNKALFENTLEEIMKNITHG